MITVINGFAHGYKYLLRDADTGAYYSMGVILNADWSLPRWNDRMMSAPVLPTKDNYDGIYVVNHFNSSLLDEFLSRDENGYTMHEYHSLSWEKIVKVEVACWGKIVEDCFGFRAQYARIVREIGVVQEAIMRLGYYVRTFVLDPLAQQKQEPEQEGLYLPGPTGLPTVTVVNRRKGGLLSKPQEEPPLLAEWSPIYAEGWPQSVPVKRSAR